MINKPERYNGKKKKKTSSANGAGLTGYLNIEEFKEVHMYYPVQNSSISKISTKSRYTDPDRRETEKEP